MSVAAAAGSGDRRATLIAMRDKLAVDMDEAAPAVVAQIAGRLSAVLLELESLSVPQEVSALDELKRRRQDRFAATADGSTS